MAVIVSLAEAVDELVHDGDTVALEGFTHLIRTRPGTSSSAGPSRPHARADDPRRRLRPADRDGLRPRLVFSWGGNPGVGSLHRFRDAVENGWPAPLELEEHSHAGMAAAYAAGAARLPSACCAAMRAPTSGAQPAHRAIECPFTGEELAAVAAHRPDVGIIHAQRADRRGNVQLWGILGVQKEAVLARPTLVTVEEIVDELEPLPGAIVLPAWVVDAVALAPGGAHPSYAHGYYERDNDFYVALGRDQPRPRPLQRVDGAPRAGHRGRREYRRSLEPTRSPA